MSEWISVKDRLPEDEYGKDCEDITVIVCTKSRKVCCIKRERLYAFDNETGNLERTDKFLWGISENVTHWMPLPEPPEPAP